MSPFDPYPSTIRADGTLPGETLTTDAEGTVRIVLTPAQELGKVLGAGWRVEDPITGADLGTVDVDTPQEGTPDVK